MSVELERESGLLTNYRVGWVGLHAQPATSQWASLVVVHPPPTALCLQRRRNVTIKKSGGEADGAGAKRNSQQAGWAAGEGESDPPARPSPSPRSEVVTDSSPTKNGQTDGSGHMPADTYGDHTSTFGGKRLLRSVVAKPRHKTNRRGAVDGCPPGSSKQSLCPLSLSCCFARYGQPA